jgi:hypothetical protein
MAGNAAAPMARKNPMKLKAVVDSLESVDEKFRELYTEFDAGEGNMKFRLNVDGLPEHPDAKALKNAHDRTKQRVKDLQAELDEAKEKAEQLPEDFDADLYERAVTEGVGGGKEPKDAEQIRKEAADAATKRAEEKAAKEIDKLSVRAETAETRLHNMIKRQAIDEALEENNITDPALRKGARALLLPLIEVHEDEGELVALAKDPSVGDTIPVAEHVKAWAQTDEGKAYVSARESAGGGASGGGKGGTGTPGSTDNPWKKGDSFNVTRQAQLRREDPERAAQLMREAGVPVPVA